MDANEILVGLCVWDFGNFQGRDCVFSFRECYYVTVQDSFSLAALHLNRSVGSTMFHMQLPGCQVRSGRTDGYC